MGILRLYLALCVVAAHAGPWVPWQVHDGRQSVQIFYIISGFYMALVLSSRYTNDRDFYASRFMRIFPPYWIVLAGTLALSVVAGLLSGKWLVLSPYADHPLGHNGLGGILLGAAANLTLFGQDWLLFLSHVVSGPLHFTANFKEEGSPLWHYLLVPQCWSIGLELTFYAIAPFLNRARTRWLVILALGAFALRIGAYWGLGLDHDPWTYRFFPFELGLFLLGMLGYRFYAGNLLPHRVPGWARLNSVTYLLGAVLLLALLYLSVRTTGAVENATAQELAVLVAYPAWALVGIPLLFYVSGSHPFDRMIGELSYPIYLLHYLVAAFLRLFPACVGFGLGKASALVSIILAALLYRVLIVPLDRKRHSLPKAVIPSASTAK